MKWESGVQLNWVKMLFALLSSAVLFHPLTIPPVKASFLVIGAAIALVPGNLITLLVRAQIVNGVITPILLTYVVVLANRRRVLGPATNGPVFRVLAGICVAGVATMSALVVIDTCAHWLGV